VVDWLQTNKTPSKTKESIMAAIIDDNIINSAYAKWSPIAAQATPSALPAPVAVILGEAVEVGMIYSAYWQPHRTRGGQVLPSFSAIADKSALYEDLGKEIYELHITAAKVQADYVRAVEASNASPMDRAEYVVQEIKSTLEFLFDDDEHTIEDDQLAKVDSTYPNPTSQDVMALTLEAYAGLAGEHRERLVDLPGFDVGLIDEARNLAIVLRNRSGEALLADLDSGIKDLLDERNRLLSLLVDRVAKVRRAARYVFRAYPETARKFASGYERTRRRATRRKQAAAAPAQSAAATAE
jgi:hypothetical protein